MKAKDLKYLAETLFLFYVYHNKTSVTRPEYDICAQECKICGFQGVLLLLYDQLNQPFFVDALDGVVGVVASVVSWFSISWRSLSLVSFCIFFS